MLVLNFMIIITLFLVLLNIIDGEHNIVMFLAIVAVYAGNTLFVHHTFVTTALDLQLAQQFCEKNDGIESIYYKTITCKNGAEFNIAWNEIQIRQQLNLPPEKE